MIKEVLENYFPQWEAPEDTGATWIKCECPVHDDENPSSSVSYDLDAFNCHGCGYSGDYIKIIEKEEDCSFVEAQRIAAGIAEASGVQIPRSHARKHRRGVSRPARFAG